MNEKDECFSYDGKREILKRLHFVSGQLGGIEKMIDDERSVKEIYTQLRAAENALHGVIYDVLERQIKRRFIDILQDRLERCPGDCADCDRLQFLKNGFSELHLKELIDELAWLRKPNESSLPGPKAAGKEVKRK